MADKRAVGAYYEQEAVRYLESLGYRIETRNFRCRQGEIDLVARESGYLVFIEVKYRTDIHQGLPQEAVDLRKQQKIARAAAFYCFQKHISSRQPCRFDVAACLAGEWTVIQNAFDATNL